MTPHNIQTVINEELDRMCLKYGDTFNTPHEAFAVTLEEIEEARDNMINIDSEKAKIWQATKNDNTSNENWTLLYHYTVCAIQELVQVAACCIKATRERSQT